MIIIIRESNRDAPQISIENDFSATFVMDKITGREIPP